MIIIIIANELIVPKLVCMLNTHSQRLDLYKLVTYRECNSARLFDFFAVVLCFVLQIFCISSPHELLFLY